MTTFADDLNVVRISDGRYGAQVSGTWDVWFPNGGYLAGLAYKAIDDGRSLPKTASIYCQYLRPGTHGPCEIIVERVRKSGLTEILRGNVEQNGKLVLILTATLTADGIDGFEHSYADRPDVPNYSELQSYDALAEDYETWPPYWRNVEIRPLKYRRSPERLDPRFLAWARLKQTVALSSSVGIGRILLWTDMAPYTALQYGYEWASPWIAPNLDLYVQFHGAVPTDEWLLIEAVAQDASCGLVGTTTRLWTESGRLIASSASQLISRPNPNYDQERKWLEGYKARMAPGASQKL